MIAFRAAPDRCYGSRVRTVASLQVGMAMANRERVEAMRSGAAQMVAQALGMVGAVDDLAGDLQVVARDDLDATFAVELLAGDDTAAFLVYGIDLAGVTVDGRDGRARLDAALATMQTAASLGAPGPRAVAHAVDERFGYVLATTPEHLRRLTGESAQVAPAPLLSTEERERRRGEALGQLADQLKGAERAAAVWLETIGDGATERREAETELALHLLEPGHLDTLMRAVNRLLGVTNPERA